MPPRSLRTFAHGVAWTALLAEGPPGRIGNNPGNVANSPLLASFHLAGITPGPKYRAAGRLSIGTRLSCASLSDMAATDGLGTQSSTTDESQATRAGGVR